MGDTGKRVGVGVGTGGWSEIARGLGSTDQTRSELEIPSVFRGDVQKGREMIAGMEGRKVNPLAYSLTPNEQYGVNMFGGMLSPGGYLHQLQGSLSGLINGDPTNNPYMQSVLDKQNLEFNRALSTGLDSLSAPFQMAGHSMGGSGILGMNRRLLTENALRDHSLNVGNILAGQYNTGMGQKLQAMSMAGMPLSLGSSAMGFAGLPRELIGQQDQAQLQLDQIPFSMLMQLLSGTPVGYPAYNPSEFSQNLGAIGGFLGNMGEFGKGVGSILAA